MLTKNSIVGPEEWTEPVYLRPSHYLHLSTLPLSTPFNFPWLAKINKKSLITIFLYCQFKCVFRKAFFSSASLKYGN